MNTINTAFHRLLMQIKNIVLMVLLYSISVLANATDLQASMSINPDQCVVMSQGQACYMSVELNWKMAQPDNYCLYLSGKTIPLTCWKNSAAGEFKKSFTSKDNLVFTLKRENDALSLVTARVKIAWVHKKKGQARTSWRLF